jgi:hypothetical protein
MTSKNAYRECGVSFDGDGQKLMRAQAEVRRLHAWLRWWNNGVRDEHLFYLLSVRKLRDCIAGKPAPRARKVKP